MLQFTTTKTDTETIHLIVKRALMLNPRMGSGLTLMMDISACHANGCELDLVKLLQADDANFMHDVIGIHFHIDRETGKLTDCFVPRFAKR